MHRLRHPASGEDTSGGDLVRAPSAGSLERAPPMALNEKKLASSSLICLRAAVHHACTHPLELDPRGPRARGLSSLGLASLPTVDA